MNSYDGFAEHPVCSRTDERQVQNNAGGFVYKLSVIDRLRRFLILGSDANTYYATSEELALENAGAVISLLVDGKGLEIVEEIVAVSTAGRAPKQGPGLLALAIVLVYTNQADVKDNEKLKVRKAGLAAIAKVCRTASTLYQLFDYYKNVGVASGHVKQGKMAGWGYAMRVAVADWFLNKSPSEVAMQVTKYPQRAGISARDLLRLSHARPKRLNKRERAGDVPEMSLVLRYAAHPDTEIDEEGPVAVFLKDARTLKSKDLSLEGALETIRKHHGLGWEHIGNSSLLNEPELWAVLLERGMGLTALIRNLKRFLKNGLLHTRPDCLEAICDRITDEASLKSARVHPLRLLLASRMLSRCEYSLDELEVPTQLQEALDLGFERAFAGIEPTGQRLLVAVDISGSMGCGGCVGTDCLSPREAAAAVAMMLVRKEENVQVVAFCDELMEFPIAKTDSLENVLETGNGFMMGATDCSLPMQHAREQGLDVDAFLILTDSETWRGEHAAEELRKYRASRACAGLDLSSRQPAKLLVCAFSSTGFSIADPTDRGMLDVAGLDASLPEIMRGFLLGEI